MDLSPYDTLVCRPYNAKKLAHAVTRANIETPLPHLTTPMGNVLRQACFVPPKDDYHDVPGFTQPIQLGDSKTPLWVIDARPFMRWDRRNDSYRLTAENDYLFQCVRLALTQAVQEEGVGSFHRLMEIPAKTFVRWITLALAQRYNLDLDSQMRVSVIAAYYFYARLEKDHQLVTEHRHRLANKVSQITAVPTPRVLDMADDLPQMADAEQFAAVLGTHSGSLRLEKLRFTDLFVNVASSWVGVHARENVGVAMEHVPTFIALVYSALGERSYRKTLLARRAETTGRINETKQFVDQVYRIVESRFT